MMIEIKQILVPVDFSPPSRKALDYAVAVATAFRAEIVLASVIENPVIAPYFPGAMPESKPVSADEVTAKLEALVPRAVRDSLRFRFLTRRGAAEEEILSAIAEERPDLVVMGTHGRRAFRRWFLGSVTEHLLRKVPVPVLTVSHPENDAAPWSTTVGPILYATDLSTGSDLGLRLAYGVAQRFGAELTVLHAVHLLVEYGAMYPQMVNYKQLKQAISVQLTESIPESLRADPKVRVELIEGIPYQVILETADRLQVGLTVINLHGKHRLDRALLGATAERVVRAAHGPVLSIPLIDIDHT